MVTREQIKMMFRGIYSEAIFVPFEEERLLELWWALMIKLVELFPETDVSDFEKNSRFTFADFKTEIKNGKLKLGID